MPPTVSRAERVMMLITPLTALAPHSVAPGPRITSMRSMSSSIRFCMSQYTPEYVWVYTDRPSISTSSLLANCWLKPRMPTAVMPPEMRATSTPGAMPSTSVRRVAPERRMSSAVITCTAAAVSFRA